MSDAIQIILSFLWAFYWPLLFVRLKGLSAKYDLTKKKLLACAVIAAAASAGNALLNFAFFLPLSALSSIMILSAAVPIATLLALEKRKRRTHIKLLILAGYFHIFWQLPPSLDIYPIIADIAMTGALFVVARAKFRAKLRRREKVEHVHGPISELWK